ncbi:hypothetical protein RCL1_000413 [Eukaryota sp. TZLM3-RCL]
MWMSDSWRNVSPEVILNSWRRARLYDNQREGDRELGATQRLLSYLMNVASPSFSEEAIFGWVIDDERNEQEQQETEYAIESCIERAFQHVVGSSHNFHLDAGTATMKFQALEQFLFQNVKHCLYNNSFLNDVINTLEDLQTQNGEETLLGTDEALSSALMVKQFVVQQDGIHSAINLRLQVAF